MKKNNINAAISLMKENLSKFSKDIFGEDSTFSEKEENAIIKMAESMLALSKNPNIDYDLMVTVKYRMGTAKKGKGVTNVERKSIGKALDSGFTIPAEATSVDVTVRLQLILEGLNGKKMTRQFGDSVLDYNIFLGDSEISIEEGCKKHGITNVDEMLMPVESFKDSKVLQFVETTYENTL